MQRNQEIIVCSVQKSQTSTSVVHFIRRLCPQKDVRFQTLDNRARFDGSKVVFCHSSSGGRLALTDVNDSIFDEAVTKARRTAGKSSVAFVVTDVEAEDNSLRKSIIKTQPTLISNTNLLVLVNSVDDMDDDVKTQFTEFLTMTGNGGESHNFSKYLPHLAIAVVIIACFVNFNFTMHLVGSRIKELEQTVIDQQLFAMNNTWELKIQRLETSLLKKMDDYTNTLHITLKDEIEGIKLSLTKHIDVHTTDLTVTISNRTDDVRSSVKQAIQDSVDKLQIEFKIIGQLVNGIKIESLELQTKFTNDISNLKAYTVTYIAEHLSNLQTELNYEHQKTHESMEGQRLQMESDIGNKIETFQSELKQGLQGLRSNLKTDLYDVTNGVEDKLLRNIKTIIDDKLDKKDKKDSGFLNIF